MNYNQLLLRKHRRWILAIGLATLCLILFSAIYLMVGELFISPFQTTTSLEQQLVFQLRLPRLIAAIVIGAGLAVSGATLQVLLGNVLAEPGVLGISGGASVMMVGLLFFFPVLATPLGFMFAAMIGSLVFTFILVMVARRKGLTTARLLLIGVALGILASAIVTWAFYFSDDLSLRQLMYWLMGSIGGVSWSQHVVSLFMLPVVVWLCWQGSRLDKLMMGELHAKQLGVDIAAVRWKLIFAVSLLVGGAVALGGMIGFIGLVIPHLLRMSLGSENRYLLPISAIAGAAFLVAADIIARVSLQSAELPLGVVTTSIGAPIFIWMLVKNHLD